MSTKEKTIRVEKVCSSVLKFYKKTTSVQIPYNHNIKLSTVQDVLFSESQKNGVNPDFIIKVMGISLK